ncbi:hypothetical protein KJ865_04315, partial [Myxococcota bacterium]|nr:hypothetical protein [Myxococcota bacterium]
SETNPYGRKDVRFVQMDFIKVGLETEAVATNLVISDATGHEDALTHDLESTAAEVAGFTLTMDLDESIADHESIDANFVAIKSHIVSALGGENAVIMRASGSKTLSHEEYPTYVNAIFDVSTSGVNAIELRNQLIGAIMRRSLSNFTGLPDTGQLWSPTGSNFVISLSVQKAEPKKWNGTEWVISDQYLVIQGGVTSLSNYTNPSYTSIMNLDDLSNSTGYAGFSASEETECEPYSVGTVPVADIIWVIDESGSMYDKQSSVASNAVDFFNRAIAYGLDFRMGVVGVGEDQVKLCTGQNESADYFLTPSDLNRFQQCVMEPNGEYPAEGGSEYGITTGYNAIMNHLPRVAANPGKIRPNAQLVVIYVSDERAEELKEFCGGSESSGMDNIDPTCMWSQIGPTIQQLNGETGTGGIGKAHAIIGPPPNGCDSAVQVGQGYLDIVQYLGGQVGSVCQTNLGPTLQVIIEDIVASSSPVRLAHVPISLSIAGAKDGIALERSRSNGFDYRASANAIVFIGQTFDPNHPSEILISYWRWVTDVVPVD